jgi:hypothetical protein
MFLEPCRAEVAVHGPGTLEISPTHGSPTEVTDLASTVLAEISSVGARTTGVRQLWLADSDRMHLRIG